VPQLDFDEVDIVACCAERFNGWEFDRCYPFDFRKAVDDFFVSGEWDLPPAQKLCMFFFLYEGLFKVDLRNEPRHGKYWRAFRTLFFAVASLDVPPEFRVPEHAERWEEEFRPQLSEVVGCIRRIHEGTEYDDHAWPKN
jgi:hypothetical protein